MDAAALYAADCFPARRIFRTNNAGAGHWLLARRGVQDGHFRAVVRSASSTQKMAPEIGEITHQTRRSRSTKMENRAERVLDGPLLMKTHHVRKPSDLCAADVSDEGLTSAQWEEFQQFTCLAYINASENSLRLEAFRTFPALRELDLSMNGIRRITVIPGELPQLEVLDLSYNSLSPGDVPQLGALPRLRVLCLTGNGLTNLPPDLSAPATKDGEAPMFPSLEVLMLDDNLLSHPSVFVSLAGLQGLQLLNLDKNTISAVPYLPGSSPSIFGKPEPEGYVEGRGHMTQEMTEDELERSRAAEDRVEYTVLRNRKDPDRTEVIFPSRRHPFTDRLLEPLDVAVHPSSLPGALLSPTESPPLPSLRILSLADNKIRYEEDVLPVALLPSLEELIITGNPLATLRKGEPPLLGSFLQQRLGIKVIRKKSAGFHKPHLIIPRKEKRKVRTHIPKIPKQPLMLESLLSSFPRLPHPESDVTESVMSSSPLPPIRNLSARSMDTPLEQSQECTESSQNKEEEMSFSCDPDVESVFMTQVDNIPDSPAETLRLRSPRTAPEERESATDRKTESKKVPEKFRGYEELLDVRTDPAFIEPVGIQNNVRALEYALRRLLVYRDYKPKLHSVQKPYVPQESKLVKDVFLPSWKSKQDAASEVLSRMKQRRHLLEVPLGSALQECRSSQEHREAKLLLKELQKKYKFFQAEVMKRASEVEGGLRAPARPPLRAQRKAGDDHRRATNGKI
ncbi:X-ray radiation resistance-associated protein 1 isoform X2 [Eleutherodactylus coqui]